jgi:hypothetical protein
MSLDPWPAPTVTRITKCTFIRQWAPTAARWRTSDAAPRKRKRRAAAPPRRKCSKMPSALSPPGTSARSSGCRCCSRRRSAPRSPPAIGFCGYTVRLAGPLTRSTYAPSTSPQRDRVEPHSRFVLPVMSAELTICRVGAAITNEHRRRNARRASPPSAWRVERRRACSLWPQPCAR